MPLHGLEESGIFDVVQDTYTRELLSWNLRTLREDASADLPHEDFGKSRLPPFTSADEYVSHFQWILLHEMRFSLAEAANRMTLQGYWFSVVLRDERGKKKPIHGGVCLSSVEAAFHDQISQMMIDVGYHRTSMHSRGIVYGIVVADHSESPSRCKIGGWDGRELLESDVHFIPILNYAKETISPNAADNPYTGETTSLVKCRGTITFNSLDDTVEQDGFPNSGWWFPITQVDTLFREGAALLRFPMMSLANSILLKTRPQREHWEFPEELLIVDKICSFMNLDPDQKQSVRQQLFSNDQIGLIHGPPGTGKTWALLALLSAHISLQRLRKRRVRVFVVAPSHAAVETIARQIFESGIAAADISGTPKYRFPNVVRYGYLHHYIDDAFASRPFCLMAARRYNFKKLPSRSRGCSAEYSTVSTLDHSYECEYLLAKQQLQRELEAKSLRISKIIRKTVDITESESGKIQEGLRQDVYDLTSEYDFIQEKLDWLKSIWHNLNDAENLVEIFLSTLASAGRKTSCSLGVNMVICDEAAQCTEPTALCAMFSSVQKMVLIGDHLQLAPLVNSPKSKRLMFNKSMFERLQTNNVLCTVLQHQYRMTPTLSEFPFMEFYEKQLKVQHTQDAMDRDSVSICDWTTLFGSLRFFDVIGDQERPPRSTSLINRQEASFVISLIRVLTAHEGVRRNEIGIISFYADQVRLLRDEVAAAFNEDMDDERESISIATVDSFQGSERRIIVLSCVRGFGHGGLVSNNSEIDRPEDRGTIVGFVSDRARLNVAMTRARDALWVVGNSKILSVDPTWSSFVEYCRSNSLQRVTSRMAFDEFAKLENCYVPVQTLAQVMNEAAAIQKVTDKTYKEIGEYCCLKAFYSLQELSYKYKAPKRASSNATIKNHDRKFLT